MSVRVGMIVAGLLASAGLTASAADAPAAPPAGLTCPPDFLTDVEQKMFAKEGQIRSGPWHVKCFQNGVSIYDRDRLYAFCKRNDARASLEGADGHPVRFQFPPEIACVWER